MVKGYCFDDGSWVLASKSSNWCTEYFHFNNRWHEKGIIVNGNQWVLCGYDENCRNKQQKCLERSKQCKWWSTVPTIGNRWGTMVIQGNSQPWPTDLASALSRWVATNIFREMPRYATYKWITTTISVLVTRQPLSGLIIRHSKSLDQSMAGLRFRRQLELLKFDEQIVISLGLGVGSFKVFQLCLRHFALLGGWNHLTSMAWGVVRSTTIQSIARLFCGHDLVLKACGTSSFASTGVGVLNHGDFQQTIIVTWDDVRRHLDFMVHMFFLPATWNWPLSVAGHASDVLVQSRSK